MIIVFATDDSDLYRAAQRDANSFPDLYGDVYTVFDLYDTNPSREIPELGTDEDLFITAHGTEVGDDGNAVIGSQEDDFWVNAIDFWENIRGIIPDMYSGQVFIDACNSADWGDDGDVPSFASALQSQIQKEYGGVEVFGRTGSPDVLQPIPAPDDTAWVPAFDD